MERGRGEPGLEPAGGGVGAGRGAELRGGGAALREGADVSGENQQRRVAAATEPAGEAAEIDANGPPGSEAILDGAETDLGRLFGGTERGAERPSADRAPGAAPTAQIPEALTPAPEPIQSPIANGIEAFRPADLQVDARRFQFKDNTDEAGVSDCLKGVTKWDLQGRHGAGVARQRRQELHCRWAPAPRARQAHRGSRSDAGSASARAGVARGRRRLRQGGAHHRRALRTSRKELEPMRQERFAIIPSGRGSAAIRAVSAGARLSNLSDDAFGMAVNEGVPPNFAAPIQKLSAFPWRECGDPEPTGRPPL